MGWKANQMNEINIKLVKNSPIRGLSFIELPRNFRKLKKWLLNIRNTADRKCFAFCFTAEYHGHFKQKQTSDTQNIGRKKRDEPRVFNPEFRPLAHGILRRFQVPHEYQRYPPRQRQHFHVSHVLLLLILNTLTKAKVTANLKGEAVTVNENFSNLQSVLFYKEVAPTLSDLKISELIQIDVLLLKENDKNH